MKSLLVLVAIAVCGCVPVYGQADAGAAGSPSPAASATPSPTPANAGAAASTVPLPLQPGMPGDGGGQNLEKSLPLIPDIVPNLSGRVIKAKGSNRPGMGPTPHATFAVESDIRVRILLRAAETQAKNAPDLETEWAAAHKTRTDPERRAALINYYNHLYDRMIKIDPSIADNANLRRTAIIDRMYYARLGDLPPDEAAAAPTPDEEGPNPPGSDEPL